MVWTGSITKDWVNKETDERIEFRLENDMYNIWWIGTVHGEHRGDRIGKAKTKRKAKQIALNKINKVGENNRLFSKYE